MTEFAARSRLNPCSWEGRPSGSMRRGSHPAALFYVLAIFGRRRFSQKSEGKALQERHFVLAGIAVFERQAYWLQNGLDRLTSNLGHNEPDNLELHGNAILAGRGWWRKMKLPERRSVIVDGLEVALSLTSNHWRLFGVVVDKRSRSPEDPIEYAFEQICSRFDRFLNRLYHQRYPQRGLIVLDKSAQETRLQSLASEFRTIGHRWGTARNLADVPLSVDSKATRAIQYADLVTYAIWRKYEKEDDTFFNVIANSFDNEGGVVHGLHHYRNLDDSCDCPGCVSRLI